MKDITSGEAITKIIDQSVIGQIFAPDLVNYCRLYAYEHGELICEKEALLTHLLFLIKGEVKIFTMLENGKVYLLRMEKAINVYGDLEILYDQSYSANVEAIGDCQCLAVPIGYIRRECLDSPSFLKYIISSLSLRLERITEISTSNLLVPLRAKLASYLMAHLIGGSNVIEIKVHYSEVAEHLGTTYRHLSRVLKSMEEEGLIKKQGKFIEVIEEDALEMIASDTYRY